MKSMLRLVAIMILISLTFSFFSASAKDINDVMDELKRAERDLEDIKDKLEDNTQQQKATASQLEALNNELDRTERQINTLENDMEEINASIANRESELEKASQNLEDREDLLSQRVRTAYKHSSFNYISILFNATSLADFLSRFTIFKRLITVDKDLVENIKEQKQFLEDETTRLKEEKQILQIQMQTIEYRKSEYQARSTQRAALLKELEQDATEYEKALEELERASQELTEMLKKMAESEVKGTGQMIWPTPGYARITSAYGNRIHPITRKNSFHTGTDIAISHSKPIVAADSGTVVYAGSYGGYGLVVIVDHGNGISTLYAHNSRLMVDEGEGVAKGQTVSLCGTTGLSTGPHLHFEVRLAGEHTNPLDYVSR